jgi:hypothetical protein
METVYLAIRAADNPRRRFPPPISGDGGAISPANRIVPRESCARFFVP